MFISLGFKSILTDVKIFQKTIYKYFAKKKYWLRKAKLVHVQVQETMQNITAKNFNAIEENFEKEHSRKF
jgi:hypothetical protein